MGKEKPKIVKRDLYKVRFTKFELLHLRDLFSVKLPASLAETVSQKLASSQSRPLIEARLWEKIADACEEAKVPLGDDAPDFVVSVVPHVPDIAVFQVSDAPASEEDDDGDVPEEGDDDDPGFLALLNEEKRPKKKKPVKGEDELRGRSGVLRHPEQGDEDLRNAVHGRNHEEIHRWRA